MCTVHISQIDELLRGLALQLSMAGLSGRLRRDHWQPDPRLCIELPSQLCGCEQSVVSNHLHHHGTSDWRHLQQPAHLSLSGARRYHGRHPPRELGCFHGCAVDDLTYWRRKRFLAHVQQRCWVGVTWWCYIDWRLDGVQWPARLGQCRGCEYVKRLVNTDRSITWLTDL